GDPGCRVPPRPAWVPASGLGSDLYRAEDIPDQPGREGVATRGVDQQETAGVPVGAVVVGRDRFGDAYRNAADIVEGQRFRVRISTETLFVEAFGERAHDGL